MECTYIKDDGEKCRARAIKGSELCINHNPDMQEVKQLAVVKGGLSGKRVRLELNPLEVRSVIDINLLLEDTINRVRSGEMPVNIANSIGYLTGHALKAIEANEIERKVLELEAVILSRKL